MYCIYIYILLKRCTKDRKFLDCLNDYYISFCDDQCDHISFLTEDVGSIESSKRGSCNEESATINTRDFFPTSKDKKN